MSEDDPLAALSAAAKNRSAPSGLPRPRSRIPAPTPPALGYQPRRPQKKQSSYLFPIIIGIVFLLLVAGAITIVAVQMTRPKPTPTAPKDSGHQEGELFKNVPAQ